MHKTLALWLLILPSVALAGPLKVGSIAPDWALMDNTSKPAELYQETDGGNTVVMLFWASWCRICHKLIPQIEDIRSNAKQAQYNARFYALNVWENGTPVSPISEEQLSMRILLNADKVAQRYGIKLSPGVVIVGKDKRIKYIADAHSSVDEITTQVQAILAKEQAVAPSKKKPGRSQPPLKAKAPQPEQKKAS